MTWLTGWAHRRKLTVDGTKITGDLTDFPVMLVLSSGTGRTNADVTDVFDELTSMSTITTTWNPSDKGANITLSNGNLTATRTSSSVWQAARNTVGKSSGKLYWEITINTAADNYTIVGIGTSSENLTYPGSSTNGYGYNGFNGQKFTNAAGSAYGNTFTAGDVIGTALDLDSGKIWWSKNGVWQASGDPAVGTNAAFTGIIGTFYPMTSMYTNTNSNTVNFGATSFTYTPPTGFTAFVNAYADNYKKIAVTTSGGAQCYVEIERWDWGNETAYLWVKAPALTSGVDTELYLYYDVSQPDNTTYVGLTGSLPATSVWDSNFLGVWHMNQIPVGSTSVKDSTIAARHLTPAGMNGSEFYNGEVGKTIYFDGSGDYMTGSAPSTPSSWTFEGWLKPTGTAQEYDGIITIGGEGLVVGSSPIRWAILSSNNGQVGSHSIVYNTYIYIAAIKSGSSYYIYEDGIEYHTSYGNAGWGLSGLTIGMAYASNKYTGYMDEVRASNTARSQSWVRANYYSMKDDLFTFSSAENEARWYFSGYVRELAVPVSRQIYVYRRDTGELVGTTTSSGDGHYYLATAYSGAQFIVALDDESGISYNMARLDKMIPATI